MGGKLGTLFARAGHDVVFSYARTKGKLTRLAREAGTRGGTAPAVYNAANEVCVQAFLDGEMRFTDIVPTVERVLAAHDVPSNLTDLTVDDVLAADSWAREQAGRTTTP
jgi:1-deoxy-D-xylulose-5-phosphate reductoisomerase